MRIVEVNIDLPLTFTCEYQHKVMKIICLPGDHPRLSILCSFHLRKICEHFVCHNSFTTTYISPLCVCSTFQIHNKCNV